MRSRLGNCAPSPSGANVPYATPLTRKRRPSTWRNFPSTRARPTESFAGVLRPSTEIASVRGGLGDHVPQPVARAVHLRPHVAEVVTVDLAIDGRASHDLEARLLQRPNL